MTVWFNDKTYEEQFFFIIDGNKAYDTSNFFERRLETAWRVSPSAASQTLITNKRRGVGYYMMHLVRALIITFSKTNRGQAYTEANLKRITDGDDITAGKLY